MVVQDIVNRSLKRLGVLAAGEVAVIDDSNDAFDALNELMDQWAAERLEIFTVTNTTWALTPSKQTYTVGIGGDINIPRPVIVDHVNYINTAFSPQQEFLLQPLTDDAWSNITIKTLTNTFPTSWYYNPTFGASALGSLSFWMVPTSAGLLGSIYAPTPLSEFTALTQTVSIPPAYRRMMVTNLALMLAADYGVEPSPGLVMAAEESKATVKRANIRLLDMSVDAAALIRGQDRSLWYSIYVGN